MRLVTEFVKTKPTAQEFTNWQQANPFPGKSSTTAKCWEGDSHKESRENIDWVMWKDAGALDRYRRARERGLSIYDALLKAQSHNSNAQRTIERLGRDCVEEYVRTVYSDKQ
jgi:hypothetical protein